MVSRKGGGVHINSLNFKIKLEMIFQLVDTEDGETLSVEITNKTKKNISKY